MLINKDLFDIADRLKEIDSAYFVIFNEKTKKFEVHNSKQGVNTLSFIVPYDRLDKRTVDYAQKTRIENMEKIEKEIEEHNTFLKGGI